jgi:hypothetical protein
LFANPGFSLRSNPGLKLANAFGVHASQKASALMVTKSFAVDGHKSFGVDASQKPSALMPQKTLPG